MIPAHLPFGATIGEDGVWRQVLTRVPGTEPRPALFLDRDGVIVEEVHYLHRAKDMKVVPGAADVVRNANRRGVPVIVVTNQAGIGRGKYGWKEFIEVQDAMLDELAAGGAFVNAVYACPHYGSGLEPYNADNHPARKPNPGMLLAAGELMPIDFGGSWIVGDRAGDIEAARRAGCAGGVHVATGHGKDAGERDAAMSQRAPGFDVVAAAAIEDAGGLIPLLKD
ncbi:MAG: HAD family hydrolase [Rhodospirillales bacterium]|nr:HAD family hydrolase [Rhodospirillales bacterium]MBO6785437.1 HAD family hydrolase [Rhodospirillales bacterium]